MSARPRLARPSAGSAADRPVVESILAREASLIAHTDVDPKGLAERISAGRRRPVLDVIARARFDGNRLRRSAELEKQVGLRRVLGTGGRDEGRAHQQHRDTRGRSRCVHATPLTHFESTPASPDRHLLTGGAVDVPDFSGSLVCGTATRVSATFIGSGPRQPNAVVGSTASATREADSRSRPVPTRPLPLPRYGDGLLAAKAESALPS
jgi:hypothetical protein